MMWDSSITNFGSNLAVVIGINNYQNGIHPLKTAVNDAAALADLLETNYNYQVLRLFPHKENQNEATLENINKLLSETLPQKIQSPEVCRLLFYFAGHGIARNGENGPAGYLVPQNAHLGKIETFLPMQTLYKALTDLSCHHLLVILDCCFAGTFRWSSTRNVISVPDQIHKEHYDRFIRHPAWQAITSAAHNQEAIDFLTDQRGIVEFKNKQHSPFATALIEALQDMKADLTKDGVITAPELYIYLRDEVEKASSESQTPGLWPLHQHDRGEYIFTPVNFNPEELKPAPEPNENNNPYRGLKPFEEKHSRFFFGRDELVQQLYDKVATHDQVFTVVLGISGSGKSSLVKAGLIPLLRQKSKLEKSETTLANQWEILAPMRPGESPFLSLARTILPIANISVPTELAELDFITEIVQEKIKLLEIQIANSTKENGKESQQTQLLQEEKEKFSQFAETWNSDNQQSKLLLLIQHFEELYTLCQSAEEQKSEQQIQESARQKLLKQTFLATLNPLSQRLQSEPNYFIEIVTDWSQQHPGFKLLLVIDQFEELITLSPPTTGQNKQDNKPQEWQLFLNLLETALFSNLPQLKIVVTLRSDFEPRFLNSDALKSYWSKARFPVRAMRSDELRQAIERPASEMALYFEPPNLVDRLIDEVGQMPGALPLLSFTLSELYLKLAQKWKDPKYSDRALRIDAEFDKQGGVAGSLTRRATEEYNKIGEDKELGEAAQTTMRRVMLRMLTLDGGGIARRRVPESELVYTNDAENIRTEQVINHLVEARLLVKGQQETGEPYVEPAHDFLVRGWGMLQDWINEERERETLELQQRLAAQANDWERNNRPTGLLLPDGDRLNKLKEILESTNNFLNQRETEFIKSSIEQVKKLRVRPELQEKTAKVENLLSVQPLEGLLLAIQAMGQNLEELPEELLSPVQISLHKAMETARESNSFWGHEEQVNSVAFSPDGQMIVSGSLDGTVRLWDTKGNPIGEPFRGHKEQVNSVTFSPNGQMIVSGSSDKKIRLWDTKGNPIGQPFQGHENWIYSVTFSPDGQMIVSGSRDKTVRLWDLQGNSIGQPFRGHEGSVYSVAFSPDGQMIVSGSEDKTIRLWDIQSNPIGHPLQGHIDKVYSVAFSPDGQMIVSGSSDDTVRLWDIQGNPIGQPFQGHTNTVNSVAFSPGGGRIVSGSVDNTLRLWDIQGNPTSQPFRGHESFVNSVAFSPDGQRIVSGSQDKTVRLWDSEGNSIGEPLLAHKSVVHSVAFSPDGQKIVSGSSDGTVRLWDIQGNPVGQPFRVHEGSVYSVVFSPDGQKIAIASGSYDYTVRLWDIQGNPISQPFRGHKDWVYSVAFSPDGQMIVSGSQDKTVRLWDINGNPIGKPFRGHEYPLTSVAFSPDGQMIASGSRDKTVRLWDINGNPLCQPFWGHKKIVTSVAFSPDGQMIVSGSYDYTVRLWDLQGNPIGQPFQGHEDAVNSVAFSPDGQMIVSGSQDKTVRLWNINGNPIGGIFQGHESDVTSVAFSPNGRIIVSGSWDNTLRLWRGGGWRAWLTVCCNRLRYHPVFRNFEEIQNPEQRALMIAACETCKKYVWNKADSSTK